MQNELLEKYPTAELQVYVVWFSMIATDARGAWRWTGNVITDPRVVHFWDDQRVVGQWFAQQETPAEIDAGIVWDAYFLYGPEAEWNAKPEPLRSWGATVVDEFETLEKNLLPLLKETSSRMLKNKHDPRNHTKGHEMDGSIRVTSCDFVDRFTASLDLEVARSCGQLVRSN